MASEKPENIIIVCSGCQGSSEVAEAADKFWFSVKCQKCSTEYQISRRTMAALGHIPKEAL